MLKMQGCSPALVENVADWLPHAAYTTLLYCTITGQLLYKLHKLSSIKDRGQTDRVAVLMSYHAHTCWTLTFDLDI